MGKTVIAQNLKKTADRLTPDGKVRNLITAENTEPREVAEKSKKEAIAELEEQLKQLKGEQ